MIKEGFQVIRYGRQTEDLWHFQPVEPLYRFVQQLVNDTRPLWMTFGHGFIGLHPLGLIHDSRSPRSATNLPKES